MKVADACGFKTVTIAANKELPDRIQEVFDWDGPVLCNVEIRPEHRVVPQVNFDRRIEDSEPLFYEKELLDNMIV